MPQVCQVCSHPDVFEINEALVIEKRSNRTIAQQYGVHYSAVQRHREHIPELLVKASMAQEVFEADVIVERLEGLWRESIAVLEAAKAEPDGDPRVVLLAIDRAGKQVERLAELRGDISRQPQVNIALVEHPDYKRLEDVLARALEPYPAARYAVADGLADVLKEIGQ
jgi:hypothetical protein